MKIFKVAYQPTLDPKVLFIIKNEYEPSMFNNDGTMGQYEVDLVDRVEERLGLNKKQRVYKKLKSLGVDYIEV